MGKQKNISNYVPPISEIPLWSDKKRPIFDVPISFTRYTLYSDRVVIDSGILFRKQEEIRLYRIMDLKMIQGPIQRLFHVGNIRIMTTDVSTPDITLVGIFKPYEFINMLSTLVEQERDRVRIGMFETFN